MTKSVFSFSRQWLATVSVISLAALTGCSTVEDASLAAAGKAASPVIQETPEEAQTTVETIVPLPKPGTDIAAYVTPAAVPAIAPATEGEGTVEAVAALVESRKQDGTGAQGAILAATAEEQPAALEKQARVTQVAAAEAPVAETGTAAGEQPQNAPVLMTMMAMDSDFDTGEPVGLETLVARQMIVPVGKPRLSAVGYAATQPVTAAFDAGATPTGPRPDLDKLIKHYADLNGLPVELVHRVVKRESTYNPRAYSKGNYGLMQIRYNTARGMGYEGPAEGLFDAETNLKYATRYLRGAWMVADGKHDGAVKLYASGYYYHAKKKGLLEETGLK